MNGRIAMINDKIIDLSGFPANVALQYFSNSGPMDLTSSSVGRNLIAASMEFVARGTLPVSYSLIARAIVSGFCRMISSDVSSGFALTRTNFAMMKIVLEMKFSRSTDLR